MHSCLCTSHSHSLDNVITTGLEYPFQVLSSALLERMGKNGIVCSDYKEMMEETEVLLTTKICESNG